MLAAGVLACAVAAAYQGFRFGNPVLTVLWLEWGATEGAAEAVVMVGSSACAIAAVLACVHPAGAWLWVVAGWLLVTAVATSHTDSRFGWLNLGAAAARWLSPVALMALRRGSTRTALALLRGGAAATFACHGIEAIERNPAFFDYLVAAGAPTNTIDASLVAIGVADLLVAALIVTTRLRLVAGWMVLWGLVTAGARVLHSGWSAWDEFVLRLPHAAVPAALLILFAKAGDDANR